MLSAPLNLIFISLANCSVFNLLSILPLRISISPIMLESVKDEDTPDLILFVNSVQYLVLSAKPAANCLPISNLAEVRPLSAPNALAISEMFPNIVSFGDLLTKLNKSAGLLLPEAPNINCANDPTIICTISDNESFNC